MFFVWLFFYGLIMMLSHHFTSLTPWAAPAGLLVSTLMLVGYLFFSGRQTLLGFKKVSFAHWKSHLFFFPYLLPVLYHVLCFGFQLKPVHSILSIFFAVVLEEVIFRGLLLPILCKRGYLFGILLSSLLFAAAHLLNLESGAEPIYIFHQVIFAIAAGFALAGIFTSCDSLFPCIGIHFLINITAGDVPTLPEEYLLLFWLCIAVYLICGIRSIFILRKNKLHQEGMLT